MNNIQRVIKHLQLIAEDLAPVSNARLAAALLYKNKIVSVGCNQDKSHPFAFEYSKNPEAIYLHAETDCILKAKKRLGERELARSTLVVVRVKSGCNGGREFGLARPCLGCSNCIEDHNIRRVIYTENSTEKKLHYSTIEYSA